MRITGGIHRSRKLETPKGDAVRPTSDKVRQAVFNMLNARSAVEGVSVIDAFCGTGALGLEAISQGAQFCTFFDKNKNSVQLCQVNIASLKEEDRCAVQFQDVTKVKMRPDDGTPASLIFLDPPYHKDLIPPAIDALYNGGWIDPEALFVIEVAKDETVVCDLIKVTSEKIYGETKILLAGLKRAAVNQAE